MKKITVSFCLMLLFAAGLSLSFSSTSSALGRELTPAQQAAANDAKCQETANGAKCVPNCPDPASGKVAPDPSKCPATQDCRSNTANCNVVARYLNPLINALAILVGVAVTVGIIIGGIQYASSGGDPQKAAGGKKHIKNAIIALIGFLFMYSFLSFLIPGGLLVK